VTTPHGSRGGSVPPRPPAGQPQQWFVLRPWVFDVTMAGVLLRAAPRPPVPIPVEAWARAYGLARDPGSGRHAISLIGPGPDFSPQYAMTTNLDEPAILAALADATGELTPLLIDGCHRLYKAAMTGRAQIPAFVLTAAETLLIRSDAVLGPPRPPDAAPEPPQRRRSPMLTGITTRTSTPQEDAEPWPGGSAQPAMHYLTATVGMTDADAQELLKAARTAQAETGPGTLADYPVPGGDAHLLIYYAPGSRAYRLKLTAPRKNEVPPGTSAAPDAAPGGPDRPSRGAETPYGSPADDAGSAPVPGQPGPPGGAAEPGQATITATIWHNVALDGQGRHIAMLDGYQPRDPVVAVFTYQTDPGRPAEQIADEAFDTFNDHPRDPDGADLACAYYGRRLRSLSFPGRWPCCPRPCCAHCSAVLPADHRCLPIIGLGCRGEGSSLNCGPVRLVFRHVPG
jgi:hypothetical protein